MNDALLKQREWANRVYKWIHSLHGKGPKHVEQRRICLTRLLSNGELKEWEKGIVIHALGDAYAHTYVATIGGKQQEVAFGWIEGHAEPNSADLGRHHDYIAYNRGKYAAYVTNLYYALGGKDVNANALIQQLFKMSNDESQVPNTGNPEIDIKGEQRSFENFAKTKANYSYGFKPDPHALDDIEIPTPSISDMDSLMHKIENACCDKATNETVTSSSKPKGVPTAPLPATQKPAPSAWFQFWSGFGNAISQNGGFGP